MSYGIRQQFTHSHALSFHNRKVFYEGNLENIERVKEIESKNIPKDRRQERIQIMIRLKKKAEKRNATNH